MLLELKVKPGSSKDKILMFKEPNYLEISLKAKPEKNKANESLCRFLGKILNVSQNQIKILKGKTSRKKLVKVEGILEKEGIELIKNALKKG
ncbi:MAG: DUF167 domain-containing protein [Thermodesulfobacterium sp.]|uniref:UPF0235 protein ENJ03_02065 n=1 Tax=Desulfofervidus auxilii TaxID=1621989 RepID=A0A7V1I408_DESA2|nr:DUF167 domain-containing protein [Thermodesulfobacterium sp.]MCD6548963.1 DUF167 domain-containing protein [Thermodesulfobacterium sp.]HEB73989.1 DUF167 domain-containing protein [Candidatus Desulfofervidus auxilii]